MPDPIEVRGTVRAKQRSTKVSVAGYKVAAELLRKSPVAPDSTEIIELPATGSAVADQSGDFTLSVGGVGEPTGELTLRVPPLTDPSCCARKCRSRALSKDVVLRVQARPPLVIQRSGSPTNGDRITLSGRVIDESGTAVPAGLPVVLWGTLAVDPTGSPVPVVVTQTQTGGHLSADWVSTVLDSAFGRVAGSDPVPVPLDDAKPRSTDGPMRVR